MRAHLRARSLLKLKFNFIMPEDGFGASNLFVVGRVARSILGLG
jgi:hypothetical protein